jgi:putative DNA primase/helicase
MTFDEAVKVLERVGRVSWSGNDSVSAQCVAHDDYRPSLSVSRGRDGKVLLYCHAGCEYRDILSAFEGLAVSDRQRAELRARAKAPAVVKEVLYEVRDENGVLQATHVRQEDKDGNKLGMYWLGGLKGRSVTSLPLFGSEILKEIPLDVPVIVTEGAKDALARWGHGEVAVGTVTGASSIPDDDALRVLVGRPVKLWPDNDDIGRRHMARIAERLRVLNQQPQPKGETHA